MENDETQAAPTPEKDDDLYLADIIDGDEEKVAAGQPIETEPPAEEELTAPPENHEGEDDTYGNDPDEWTPVNIDDDTAKVNYDPDDFEY